MKLNSSVPSLLYYSSRKWSMLNLLTYRPDNCEAARLALLDLIPVSIEVEVPFEYHRMIIGKAGTNIKRIMEQFDVNVQVGFLDIYFPRPLFG